MKRKAASARLNRDQEKALSDVGIKEKRRRKRKRKRKLMLSQDDISEVFESHFHESRLLESSVCSSADKNEDVISAITTPQNNNSAIEESPVRGSAEKNEDVIPTTTTPQNNDSVIEERLSKIEKSLNEHENRAFAERFTLLGAVVMRERVESYQNARLNAGVNSLRQWNSHYIHGTVRVDGKFSYNRERDLPCTNCKVHDRKCIVLQEIDPYKEFLFDGKKICCGWCEHDGLENTESIGTSPTAVTGEINSLNGGIRAEQEVRRRRWFLRGAGIDEEVIKTDICRYLGNDATVQPDFRVYPGAGPDPIAGYLITSYRPPTNAMILDLKKDSARWEAEKKRTNNALYNPQTQEKYYGRDVPPYTYGYAYGLPGRELVNSGVYISRPDRTPTPCEEPPVFPGDP